MAARKAPEQPAKAPPEAVPAAGGALAAAAAPVRAELAALADGRDFHTIEVIAEGMAARQPGDFLQQVATGRRLMDAMREAVVDGTLQAHRPGPLGASPGWKPPANETVIWIKDAEANRYFAACGSPLTVHGEPSVPVKETKEQRQARRWLRFKELGGEYGNGKRAGRRGILAALEREEQADGRVMSDRKSIGVDLDRAHERTGERPVPMSTAGLDMAWSSRSRKGR